MQICKWADAIATKSPEKVGMEMGWRVKKSLLRRFRIFYRKGLKGFADVTKKVLIIFEAT